MDFSYEEREVAVEIGISESTVNRHWDEILESLQDHENKRIKESVGLWRMSYRGAVSTLTSLGLSVQWDDMLERFIVGRPLPAPDDRILQEELHRRVLSAIVSLPDKEQEIARALLVALAESDISIIDIEELARITGFSQDDIVRGLELLREDPSLKEIAEAWNISDDLGHSKVVLTGI